MNDESRGFGAAKTRLDEIVTQVRKKDTSLEKSLDLLEEGVRLANICTEQIDQTDWTAAAVTSTMAETVAADVETDTESDTSVASETTADSRDATGESEAAVTSGRLPAFSTSVRGEATGTRGSPQRAY